MEALPKITSYKQYCNFRLGPATRNNHFFSQYYHRISSRDHISFFSFKFINVNSDLVHVNALPIDPTRGEIIKKKINNNNKNPHTM